MKKSCSFCFIFCFFATLISCNKVNPDSYCVVTFDAGQGEYNDTTDHKKFVTVKYGTAFSFAAEQIEPPTAYLDFYSFSGWKNGDKLVDDFQVKNNITVVANYSYVNPITVTFDFNGGSYGDSPESISLSFKKGITWKEIAKPSTINITAPTKLKEYDDWSFSKDELNPIPNDYVIDNNLHAYVHYRPIYLTFTAIEDNSSVSYSSGTGVDITGIMCSENGTDWNNWNGDEIYLDKSDSIYVKNTKDTLSVSSTDYLNFKMTGKISASGNTNSLINYSSLSKACFYGLFSDCDSLVSAPALPSTSAVDWCYHSMFKGCTSLINAPELPATSGDNRCYQQMFDGCTSLSRAPTELPIKSLYYASYNGMFRNCSSLTKSPNILLTKAGSSDSCLKLMFAGCSSLSNIKLSNYYGNFNGSFANWVSGVNVKGELLYPGSDLSKRSESAIPFAWNVLPRYTLFTHLINCSINSTVPDYHNGENVTIKIVANDGYHLPTKIMFTVDDYNFDSVSGVLSFIAPDSNSTLLVEAIKNS